MADPRTELENERDFLLRSIDDLDAELAAGDLDPADHERLTESYTARAAAVLRQLDNTPSDDRQPPSTTGTGGTSGNRRRLAWVGGLAVAAVVAGWLLAQAAGERGTSGLLTGEINASLRDQVLTCQRIGTDPARLTESLGCFDDVLDQDPNNVEALTYRGWYVVLASGSAQQAGNEEAAAELLSIGRGLLDRAIEVDPSAAEPRAFRAVVQDRVGDTEGACADVAAISPDAPPMITQLVGPLAERLGCPQGD